MNLDSYQQAAVRCTEPRIRVLAGAGSGKTRALIERINHLTGERQVPAALILAVTFSKKAAEEMRARLQVAGANVLTLHALGYRILKSLWPDWGVADTADKRRLIRRALKETRSPVRFAQVPRMISEAKRRASCPPDFQGVYDAYERLREQARLFDFDDMLVVSERVLRANVQVRKSWQRWSYVLVDETQDTDPLQWSMLEMLVGQADLFVVGDYSQSVYGFRGAAPEEMLTGIDLRFGKFEQLELPCNYRSVSEVVGLANDAIEGKPGALSLQVVREQPGHIEWLHCDGPSGEVDAVLSRIQEYRQLGVHWSDCAILYRTNAQSERFENRLIRECIPYEIAGDFSFYARGEVKDICAYLELARGWNDEAADRVYNRPSRYLGAVWRQELERKGGWAAVADGAGFSFSRPYMAERLEDFRYAVLTLQRCYHGGTKNPAGLVQYIYDQVGYRPWLLGEEPDAEDEVKGENLEMLLEAARQQPSVDAMLDLAYRARKPRGQNGDRGVQLLTIHRGKGLEFPYVFVVGCNEGVLPHRLGDPEEELRIFYVAITRAQDRLTMTSFGIPSCYCQLAKDRGIYESTEPSITEGDEGGAGAPGGWDGGAGGDGDDEPSDECSGHLERGSGVRSEDDWL
jgi:superfamily I DNA/RNA helicase